MLDGVNIFSWSRYNVSKLRLCMLNKLVATILTMTPGPWWFLWLIFEVDYQSASAKLKIGLSDSRWLGDTIITLHAVVYQIDEKIVSWLQSAWCIHGAWLWAISYEYIRKPPARLHSTIHPPSNSSSSMSSIISIRQITCRLWLQPGNSTNNTKLFHESFLPLLTRLETTRLFCNSGQRRTRR